MMASAAAASSRSTNASGSRPVMAANRSSSKVSPMTPGRTENRQRHPRPLVGGGVRAAHERPAGFGPRRRSSGGSRPYSVSSSGSPPTRRINAKASAAETVATAGLKARWRHSARRALRAADERKSSSRLMVVSTRYSAIIRSHQQLPAGRPPLLFGIGLLLRRRCPGRGDRSPRPGRTARTSSSRVASPLTHCSPARSSRNGPRQNRHCAGGGRWRRPPSRRGSRTCSVASVVSRRNS